MSESGSAPFDPAEFARAFQGFLRQMDQLANAHVGPNPFIELLTEHLAIAPADAPVVSTVFPSYEHVNVAVAATALADELPDTRLVGVGGPNRRHASLSELAQGAWGATVGAVDYKDLAVSPDDVRASVQMGLYLLRFDDVPVAMMLRGPDESHGAAGVTIEVLTERTDVAQQVLSRVRELMVTHNVFRNQVLSFGHGGMHGPGTGLVTFLRRPTLSRDDLVLPEEALQTIERQAFGVSDQRVRLLASGQHLKRGLLLHGPPGTGKTQTVRYLLSRLTDVTAVVLSGNSLGFMSEACSLARLLQPALVVLEDCDLVAQDRDFAFGPMPTLFTVLNEMDGLGSEADVMFVLTTNRAEQLEAALVERPGRIDQAVEIALPDAAGRRALLDLYAAGATLADDVDRDALVERTAGGTASYLKELVRRAVLHSALTSPGDEAVAVDRAGFEAALAELEGGGAALTRSLLGAEQEGRRHRPTAMGMASYGPMPAVYPGWSPD